MSFLSDFWHGVCHFFRKLWAVILVVLVVAAIVAAAIYMWPLVAALGGGFWGWAVYLYLLVVAADLLLSLAGELSPEFKEWTKGIQQQLHKVAIAPLHVAAKAAEVLTNLADGIAGFSKHAMWWLIGIGAAIFVVPKMFGGSKTVVVQSPGQQPGRQAVGVAGKEHADAGV